MKNILYSDGMTSRRASALEECKEHCDYQHLALDSLFHPRRGAAGQAGRAEKGTARAAAATPGVEAARRSATVCGRTGAAACRAGAKSESGQHITQQLAQHTPADC